MIRLVALIAVLGFFAWGVPASGVLAAEMGEPAEGADVAAPPSESADAEPAEAAEGTDETEQGTEGEPEQDQGEAE